MMIGAITLTPKRDWQGGNLGLELFFGKRNYGVK